MKALRFVTMLLATVAAARALAAPNVEIVVNASLYADGQINTSLERYMTDLRVQGYSPILTTTDFTSAEALRTHLSSRYASEGLAGAVFVGDLPVAHFENSEDNTTAVFPIDLYYTDLDGTWWDLNENGKLDYHLNLADDVDVTPEIFLGRLSVSPLLSIDPTRTEAGLLNAYFDKNHAYRTGTLNLPENGLMWVDDDWSTFGEGWGKAMEASVSGTIDVVSNTNTTTAEDYISKIAAGSSPGYESVYLAAHSNAILHEFYDNGTVDDRLYSTELAEIDPQAFFYHLFACWSGDYEKQKYIAGEYVFGSENGLLALATTKKGGVLVENGDTYFDAIGDGKTYGEAFQMWMESVGTFGYDSFDRYWNYGLTLIGDPLLTAQQYRTPYLPGDLNGDGMVGSADLDLVRGNWGETCTPGDFAFGDATGDGTVNSADLDLVRMNWGRGTPTVATVPEPALAVGILTLLFWGTCFHRERRTR